MTNWLHRAVVHIREVARGAPGTGVDMFGGSFLPLTQQEVPQPILLLCHGPLCI